MKISMSMPDIGELEIANVNKVLRTPTLSSGPMLKELEEKVADYVQARFAIGVSSGTAALHLAIKAAGIKDGDEVITTPFTFVASVNCILYERGRPVFVDINCQSLNIDPDLIEEKITGRTKAILPVHVFGQPCEMDRILAIAERHHLLVIEDACEALGAEIDGQRVGTLGDIGVYAFYPNKQVTTGEGGMVVTDDRDHASLVRSLRNQGRDDGTPESHHSKLGYNYRLDELSCALGVAQLQRIEELLAKREKVAALYNERLKGLGMIELPSFDPRMNLSWFVYVIRLSVGIDRQSVMAQLDAYEIPSRAYFPPVHLLPYIQEMLGYRRGDFPRTESVSRSTLALPFHGKMREDEVNYVCDALSNIVT